MAAAQGRHVRAAKVPEKPARHRVEFGKRFHDGLSLQLKVGGHTKSPEQG